MSRRIIETIASGGVVLAVALSAAGSAHAQAANGRYVTVAPLELYLMDRDSEIALARSAGPASVSDSAGVLVLSTRGYETAVKGKNGFVCYVARAWDNEVDNAEFYNPKMRGPMCLNAAAVSWYLPYYLQRTEWVLSGVSMAEISERIKAAITAKQITAPAPGAMSFMLSKGGYLNDGVAGPWHPHVMFYGPPVAGSAWGADVAGSPVVSAPSNLLPFTMFVVPVRKWSDGTLAEYSH